MKGKQIDTSWVPSVPGPAVELSFTSPKSDDTKLQYGCYSTPNKAVNEVEEKKTKKSIFVVERNKAQLNTENDLICEEELSEEVLTPGISQNKHSFINKNEDYYLPNFNQNIVRNDSERFGLISDISQNDNKLRSDEKTNFTEEVYDFIRCGFEYDDTEDKIDKDLQYEEQRESLHEDPLTDECDLDENCKPNFLPTLKTPKAWAFNKFDIPTEKNVFDIEWQDVERNIVKKSPVVHRTKKIDFKWVTPSNHKNSSSKKTGALMTDDEYFTFRRASIAKNDALKTSVLSNSSLGDRFSRLNIDTSK